jgi:hypothetical protein
VTIKTLEALLAEGGFVFEFAPINTAVIERSPIVIRNRSGRKRYLEQFF